ncbi:MAG: RsmD family RNA methyltransferase [Intrasporangiaceae bacterium]|nr:RsmD family RNA methyltransferase [Intrasporangiaceae bacterium]
MEAVSRGAAEATLVDHDRGAVAAMRRTVADLRLTEVRIQARDVRAYLSAGPSEHDLVFIDPPYDLGDDVLGAILESLSGGWLSEDALVVVERSARSPEPSWPDGLTPEWDRVYGETALWVVRVTV